MIVAAVGGGALLNCVAHPGHRRRRLGAQESSGPGRPLVESIEEVRRGCEFPEQRNRPHYDAAESAACKHPGAFVAIAEPKKWRSGRELDRRVAKILQCAKCDSKSKGLVRLRPGGKRENPARTQDAIRLAHGHVGLREMQDPKVHHRPVESSVVNFQCLSIADLELDSWMKFPSQRHHRL